MESKDYTVSEAIRNGDLGTRISMLLMGAGNIVGGQVAKGIIFFLAEIGYIVYMLSYGFYALSELPTLGHYKYKEVEVSYGYEYVIEGIPSIQVLLYGVVTIFLTVLFIILWRETIKSAYRVQICKSEGRHIYSFREDISSLFNANLHKLLMTLPLAGILLFTVLPLIFMILQAFTNYSDVDQKLNKFEWVGFDSFKQVLEYGGKISNQFWSVLLWTIIWAFFATALNYILGMLLAIIINRKGTKLKGLWRFNFIMSVAIPQFVSLLVIRSMFNDNGTINNLLIEWGLVDPGNPLPFWTNAVWAKVTVIIINLWVGIPYTMLQITGILQNIPGELYEAAKVDGANAFVTFFKITLPYMLFVTTPYLITTFTANINNFNVIYLLTGGGPTRVGETAGQTDILVTWLYKLTIEENDYNIGAVIGIMTFVVLAIVSLLTYRSTGSYKNEEGFQ